MAAFCRDCLDDVPDRAVDVKDVPEAALRVQVGAEDTLIGTAAFARPKENGGDVDFILTEAVIVAVK